jgi:hypothetical protein
MYTEQGVNQIQAYLKYCRTDRQPSILCCIAIQWIQVSIGTGKFFLQDVLTPLPHSESKWFMSLQEYLATIKGSLEVNIPVMPPLQRQGDFYLMDSVLSSNKFNNKEIRLNNYCRLYLQAITLSDVTLANGKHIDLSMMQGHPSQLSSESTMIWINQARPPDAAWVQWRKACVEPMVL